VLDEPRKIGNTKPPGGAAFFVSRALCMNKKDSRSYWNFCLMITFIMVSQEKIAEGRVTLHCIELVL
jgi:hypothetical protein